MKKPNFIMIATALCSLLASVGTIRALMQILNGGSEADALRALFTILIFAVIAFVSFLGYKRESEKMDKQDDQDEDVD